MAWKVLDRRHQTEDQGHKAPLETSIEGVTYQGLVETSGSPKVEEDGEVLGRTSESEEAGDWLPLQVSAVADELEQEELSW